MTFLILFLVLFTFLAIAPIMMIFGWKRALGANFYPETPAIIICSNYLLSWYCSGKECSKKNIPHYWPLLGRFAQSFNHSTIEPWVYFPVTLFKALWITISSSLHSFDLRRTFKSTSSRYSPISEKVGNEKSTIQSYFRVLYAATFAFILVIQWAYKYTHILTTIPYNHLRGRITADLTVVAKYPPINRWRVYCYRKK